MHRNKRGNASAFLIEPANHRPYPFRRCENHIHKLRRLDKIIENIESVREEKRVSFPQIGRDFFRVNICGRLIREQQGKHIRLLHGIRDRVNRKAVFCRTVKTFSRAVSDNHIRPAVSQIQSLRSSLRAVAEDCDTLREEILLISRGDSVCVHSYSFRFLFKLYNPALRALSTALFPVHERCFYHMRQNTKQKVI